MPERFLITGGAGFIGAHLCELLTRHGHDVFALDGLRMTYGPRPPRYYQRDLEFRLDSLMQGSELFECCLSERQKINEIVQSVQPTIVVHLASIPMVSYATQHPQLASEYMGSGLINILEAIQQSSSVRRFVFISSSMVYGDFERSFVSEGDSLSPVNKYGGHKLSGEVLSKAYLKRTSIEATIVRPSAVYGPTDFHPRVIRKFCEAALCGDSIHLNPTNDKLLDFTHVDDLVVGIGLAALHPAAADETFNLTYGQARSLSELLVILQQHVQGITVSQAEINDTDRPRRGTLSIEKAKRLLGYAPAVSLEDGIGIYLPWLQPNRTMPPERDSLPHLVLL